MLRVIHSSHFENVFMIDDRDHHYMLLNKYFLYDPKLNNQKIPATNMKSLSVELGKYV